MRDEELQGYAEKGELLDNRDSRVYDKIFEALRREPEFTISPKLAEAVVRRIDFSAHRSSTDLIWLYTGLAACFIAMLVTALLTGFEINFGAFKFISGYKGLFVFGIFFVLALQWIDKKIVRKAV